MEISPDKLAAADRRLTGVSRQVDKLVYYWRISNIHCPADGCHKGDVTRDAIEFCEKLAADFRAQNASVEEVCEALTAAVIKLAAVPVAPPQHLWKAGGGCVCGWAGTEQEWVDHAGSGALVM